MLHIRVKVAIGVQRRWKSRLLCGSHTGCLQAESVLAFLAAHRAIESKLCDHRGIDRRFRLLVYDFILVYFITEASKTGSDLELHVIKLSKFIF